MKMKSCLLFFVLFLSIYSINCQFTLQSICSYAKNKTVFKWDKDSAPVTGNDGNLYKFYKEFSINSTKNSGNILVAKVNFLSGISELKANITSVFQSDVNTTIFKKRTKTMFSDLVAIEVCDLLCVTNIFFYSNEESGSVSFEFFQVFAQALQNCQLDNFYFDDICYNLDKPVNELHLVNYIDDNAKSTNKYIKTIKKTKEAGELTFSYTGEIGVKNDNFGDINVYNVSKNHLNYFDEYDYSDGIDSIDLDANNAYLFVIKEKVFKQTTLSITQNKNIVDCLQVKSSPHSNKNEQKALIGIGVLVAILNIILVAFTVKIFLKK